MAKRILITGASGLLGRACMKEFAKDSNWDTLGLAFSRAGNNLQKVDLTDHEQVSKLVKGYKVNKYNNFTLYFVGKKKMLLIMIIYVYYIFLNYKDFKFLSISFFHFLLKFFLFSIYILLVKILY